METLVNLENQNSSPKTELESKSTITLADLGILPKHPKNNVLKILFISLLIIFVLIVAFIAFIYFKNKNNQKTNLINGCLFKNKTYQVGESFIASDGCNTCTCESKNNINCTDNKCLTSNSVATTATASSTTNIKTTEKDCGSYDQTHIFSNHSLTNWDIRAIDCFTQAAKNCDLAIIKSEGSTIVNFSFKIEGNYNGNCRVTNIVTTEASNQNPVDYFNTCDFPIDTLLVPLIQEGEKQKMTEYALINLSSSFVKPINLESDGNGWFKKTITNIANGADVLYKCK
jgi:hypothetical protein